ncbi:MAG TPA: SGNH/GDSL hydrolase family protein [Verrucomicrobiae bacterium]|nr:SGNH/GDSL hydrolase family protein [Verrucomicrobiae bacterium]
MLIPLVVALGDSITSGYGLSAPAAQNYAALYTRRIHGRLMNLAVPGYQCDDVVNNELPKMPRGASVVILNCGTSDVGGFGYTPQDTPDGAKRTASANEAELALAQRAFARAVALIRHEEPSATIYIVNLRHWQRMTGAESRQFAADVNAWNAMVAATGLPVVDVSADPRMYRAAYFQADLLHPNAEGNAAIASDFH